MSGLSLDNPQQRWMIDVMAIRVRVPLPGPFVWSPSRRRHGGSGVGALLFFGLLLLGFCFADPWIGVPVTVLLVVLIVAAGRDAAKRQRR